MARRIKSLIEQLNPWWDAVDFRFALHNRENYTAPLLQVGDRGRNRLIRILNGARRVGKTSILQTVVNCLLDAGVKKNSIIFLTGELREVQEAGLQASIEQILARLGVKASTVLHIFVDEVQEIENWQNDVKLLYDATPHQIYLSGSSSLLLTKQTAKLTGRFKLYHVLPLSFKEFLLFRSTKSRVSRAEMDRLLEEYLHIGGYPEYVMNRDPAYLRQCIESTLYRELISAYGMRNPALLQDLLYFLADKLTNEVSVKRIQKDLKVDDRTARHYLQYLEDVYLVYPVFRAGKSNRITKGSNPKYYFNDTGVLGLMAKSFRIGHAVENAVFLKLLGSQSLREVPRVEYSLIDGQEVDFICDNQLYEVKALEDINASVLAAYSDLGEVVRLISLGDIDKFRNYSAQLKVISLRELLLA